MRSRYTHAREKMSDISGVATGRSRRVDGSMTVGLGRMTREVIVLVGEGGGWMDGANSEVGKVGEPRWREKLRNGEMVLARDVMLLLRRENDGVTGVVLAVVQKLLLLVLLPVEDDDLEEDELVPLLILRILEKALLLLTGGLDTTMTDSRHICDSGAA
jgi:hypothetical protein